MCIIRKDYNFLCCISKEMSTFAPVGYGKIEIFFYFFAKGTLKSPETSINTGEMPIFNLH